MPGNGAGVGGSLGCVCMVGCDGLGRGCACWTSGRFVMELETCD